MEVSISKEDFRFALTEFGRGEIFEDFAKSFLCHVLGDEFIPVGGSKDKGIDGSLRIFKRKTNTSFVYQISTELGYEQKIESTIKTLLENKVTVDKLIYVTGRKVNSKDTIEDNFLNKYKIPLTIFDVEWFASNVMGDERLAQVYQIFIESNIHEFRKPNKSYVVGNLIDDPRLFVFMRQQFDANNNSVELEDRLADTLILFALEGTAAEKGIFKSSETIKNDISKFIKFDLKLLYGSIDKRLLVLSEKPLRMIKYHKNENAYCLPYTTRLEIIERDILETRIFKAFQDQTTELLKKHLQSESVVATNAIGLIESTIHKIYYKQGLEFSSFIIDQNSRDIKEIALADIVGEVVDESHIKLDNKEKVKKALLMTIRHISYNGTLEQREYLRRLSHTYNMMFMLKWDPQLATSFQAMASKLKIFIGTSILIPAISEIYLEPHKRRFWNLIEGAHLAGVNLTINDNILNELCNHLGMIKNIYKTQYKRLEEFYLEDESRMVYIDEIMIRAYFYSRKRGRVRNFETFLQNFIEPNMAHAQRDLKAFLADEFHITYENTSVVESKIDFEEEMRLTEKLTIVKNSKERAKNDARLILMLYKQRELNNEGDGKDIFGYRTWWLSKDVYTYKTIKNLFGNKYNVSCYMRSDFLYNYISLAPKKEKSIRCSKKYFQVCLELI
jgi:hypothetical protein